MVAGCGAHASGRSPPAPWRANAVGVVRQLRGDVAVAKNGGTTRAAAAQRLADISELYALLVVYDDLGSCSAMAAKAGAPPTVERALAAPCPALERAAALFASAAAHTDARALVRATNEVLGAEPLLVRALAGVSREPAGRSTASTRSRDRRGRERGRAR